ncbi:MAG: hypothetical protein LBI10_02295 [Deltaproteobacteria bacterium]|nr:hypothetical protein [Deltaproteobacteria bacterium]
MVRSLTSFIRAVKAVWLTVRAVLKSTTLVFSAISAVTIGYGDADYPLSGLTPLR